MNYFSYPIDSKKLIRAKRTIKKELLSTNKKFFEKRIAVLGGSTTSEVVDQLDLFLLSNGIKAIFYESEFGQFWEDAVFSPAALKNFNPDIIYIYTSWRNIQKFPDLNDTPEDIEVTAKREFERFVLSWDSLNMQFNCPIIQNNFDRPDYRLLGNRDIWDCHGRSNYISRLNQMFYEYAQKHNNFYINDLEYISQDFGLSRWNSAKHWYLYKYAMNIEAIPFVAESVSNIIKSIYGRNKKVLALDLDNTLWGGIIGDDGVEGLALGPETPAGQAFLEFQKYCKELKKIGVVLAINSKNEYKSAIDGLNHPNSILKPDDFVSIKANWSPKNQNLVEIANELSLGIDSFVFVDDNPAERAIVSDLLSGDVVAPEMNNVEEYVKILDHGGFFEVTTISSEDQNKTQLYIAKAKAKAEVSKYTDYGDYLDSLKMTAKIEGFEDINIPRISQLTNKSNQFNLTTLRCSEGDILNMKNDGKHICLCGRLIDKFGDNGIVSVVIGEINNCHLDVILWLMSCRVLKRELEDAMLNVLVEEAASKGIKKIYGYYYPTQKNVLVKDFWEKMGLSKISEDLNGNTKWELKIPDYISKKPHMIIEKNNKRNYDKTH